MDRQWGSGDFWGGIGGNCVTPGRYHVTNVIDEAQFMDVRLIVHRGTPDTMRAYRNRIEFPNTDDAVDGYFQIYNYDRELTFPVPLPASRVMLFLGDEEVNLQDDVPGRTARQYKGVHSNRADSLTEELLDEADIVLIELHAEELYDHLDYRFKPREVVNLELDWLVRATI